MTTIIMDSNAQKGQRIQWIDALRGITMFLVVFQHIFTYCFHGQTEISLFLKTFRMPLFFFISGFVAADIKRLCTPLAYKQQMLKKIRIQTIPMLVFGLIFTAVSPFALNDGLPIIDRIEHFITSPWKYGYWFTWALLGMFVIYYSIAFLLHNFSRKWTYLTLLGISLMLFIYSPSSLHSKLDTNNLVVGFFSLRHIAHYFQFFVFGSIFAHYRERIFGWLENKYVSGTIVSLFFGLYLILYVSPHLGLARNQFAFWIIKFVALIQKYCGVVTMTMLFRNHGQTFSNQKKIGRTCQFLGRRTLDIYLIHFFFLPDMESIASSVYLNHNILLSTAFAILLAAIVMALSLIVSSLLRTSPLLAHYLFGQKYSTRNT